MVMFLHVKQYHMTFNRKIIFREYTLCTFPILVTSDIKQD